MYSSYAIAAAVCSVIFPIIAIVAVGFRLRARRIKSLPFGSDDYLVFTALVFAVAGAIIVLYGSFRAGIGQQLSTMTPSQFAAYQKHLYFDVIVIHAAIGFIKMSVLELYKRIFSTKNFHTWANVVMGFVVMWTLGAFFTQIFSAWPISNWWNKQAGYVLNYGAFLTAFAAMDLLLDIIILCLPLPIINSLHMSRKRKFTVMGMFWLGGFCVVSAAVRLYFSYALTIGTDNHPTDDHFSYVSVNNVIWALIEPCASIVACCLPTFRPLFNPSWSLKALARCFQISSNTFSLRRSTGNSNRSKESFNSGEGSREAGWLSSQAPRVATQGPWSPLPEGGDMMTYRADMELGDNGIAGGEGGLPIIATRVYRAERNGVTEG